MTEDLGVVVAIDGSPSACNAIRWAARDAELRGTTLTIVTACRPVIGDWLSTPVPAGVLESQKQSERQIVDDAIEMAKEVTSGGLQMTTKLMSSAPVHALTELSEDRPDDRCGKSRQREDPAHPSGVGEHGPAASRPLPGRGHP